MKTEDDINAGIRVKFRGRTYITGNRRLNEVELYRNGKFVRTVHIAQIRLA